MMSTGIIIYFNKLLSLSLHFLTLQKAKPQSVHFCQLVVIFSYYSGDCWEFLFYLNNNHCVHMHWCGHMYTDYCIMGAIQH